MTKYDIERIKAVAFDVLSATAASREELPQMLSAMGLLIQVLEAEQERLP